MSVVLADDPVEVDCLIAVEPLCLDFESAVVAACGEGTYVAD